MISRAELDKERYKNLLFILKNSDGMPEDYIQQLHAHVGKELHEDCANRFKKLTEELRNCMQFYDELCDTDPTDMSVMYENVTKQAFHYAAHLAVGMHHLNELRQYLRELSQLDK